MERKPKREDIINIVNKLYEWHLINNETAHKIVGEYDRIYEIN